MRKLKNLLGELDACNSAVEWAGDKTIEEVIAQCHRGDWLLWLAKKVDVDIRLLTLAKGRCANTVRHLMTDERSINAVDMAIAFGEGKATLEQLIAAAVAAYSAYSAAYSDAAAVAAYSAYSAAYSVAADAAVDAYSAAKKENQLLTANICREIIGNEIIDKVNKILINQ